MCDLHCGKKFEKVKPDPCKWRARLSSFISRKPDLEAKLIGRFKRAVKTVRIKKRKPRRKKS